MDGQNLSNKDYLGNFNTKEEAASAYDVAASEEAQAGYGNELRERRGGGGEGQ